MLVMYTNGHDDIWICVPSEEDNLLSDLKEEGRDLRNGMYERYEMEGGVIQVTPTIPNVWGKGKKYTGNKYDPAAKSSLKPR